jgi:hypothetical protein
MEAYDLLMEHPRTLGVPGEDTPRIGDVPGEPTPLNLSIDHESAEEHLANAQMLLRCADFLTGEQKLVTIDAAFDRIAMAVRAMGERRLVARSSRAEMAVSA